MTPRSPYDGKPFYCSLCAAGYDEYMACEEVDCQLESESNARLRQVKKQVEDENKADTRHPDQHHQA